MLTPIEVLKAGLEQMTPETWTQEYWARDVKGIMRHTFDEEAVCWCSTGWVHKLTGPESRVGIGGTHTLYWQVVRRLQSVLPEKSDGSIALFNDTHKFEEVRALWEAALKKEEEETA